MSAKSTECKAIVPSSLDWTTEPVQYFHIFFNMDVSNIILQETTLNGTYKRARITDWVHPTLGDIRHC
jgi:hypothetical protein